LITLKKFNLSKITQKFFPSLKQLLDYLFTTIKSIWFCLPY